MITRVHTMFYTSDAEATRAFLRDVLGFTHFDAGGGWLIFDLPAAEMGCHPDADADGKRAGTHVVSFMCDDLDATVAELRGRGVEFTSEIADQGYGRVIRFRMPGGVEADLYQPAYRD